MPRSSEGNPTKGQKSVAPPLFEDCSQSQSQEFAETSTGPHFAWRCFYGRGRNMPLVLIAVAVCALWLCWDLWPLASSLSIRVGNKYVSSFRRHFGNFGQGEAEEHRRRLIYCSRSIFFVTFCLAASSLFFWASNAIINQHISDEENDAYNHLDGALSLTSDRLLRNATFTVRNNSSEDIRTSLLSCWAYNALMDDGSYLGSAGTGFPIHGTLHAGGDAASWSCPGNGLLMMPVASSVTCADVKFTLGYEIFDAPTVRRAKPYRYILYPGNHDWIQVALDSPPYSCEGDKKR